LFVFNSLSTGNFEATRILAGGKIHFSFGDLKEAKTEDFIEYVLIGTTSFE
jgi:hypothetical protein